MRFLNHQRGAGIEKNVLTYGAKNTGDPLDASANVTAITAAMAGGGRVYLPAGTYYINGELKMPNNTEIYGDGMDITYLIMASGTDGEWNMITNTENTHINHSTTNKNLYVHDLTLDGNGTVRTQIQATLGSTTGSNIGWAGVENSVIERVRSRRAFWHCFTVDASTYTVDGSTVYPLGPSVNVHVVDCVGEDPTGDDAFTCHASRLIRFEKCRAIANDGFYVSWISNGFEVDEGSIDCSVEDCFSYRFSKGFQTKGHATTIPAIRTKFNRCIAEKCEISFTCEANGIDVEWHSCISMMPGNAGTHDNSTGLGSRGSTTPGPGHYAQNRSIEMGPYSGAVVKDFLAIGGSHNNVVINGTTDVLIDGITFYDISSTALNTLAPGQGMVHVWGNGLSDHVTIRNVIFRPSTAQANTASPLVSIGSSVNPLPVGKNFVVEDIQGTGTGTQACVVLYAANAADVMRVTQTGYASDLNHAGTLTKGEAASQTPLTDWHTATLNAAWTGNLYYIVKNGVCFLMFKAVTAPATGNAALAAGTVLTTLPAGFRPPTDLNMVLIGLPAGMNFYATAAGNVTWTGTMTGASVLRGVVSFPI